MEGEGGGYSTQRVTRATKAEREGEGVRHQRKKNATAKVAQCRERGRGGRGQKGGPEALPLLFSTRILSNTENNPIIKKEERSPGKHTQTRIPKHHRSRLQSRAKTSRIRGTPAQRCAPAAP